MTQRWIQAANTKITFMHFCHAEIKDIAPGQTCGIDIVVLLTSNREGQEWGHGITMELARLNLHHLFLSILLVVLDQKISDPLERDRVFLIRQ